MYTLLMVFHIVACLALILIVLLQTGRGAEMGAAFGGASQTLFGGSGGNTFLTRLTTGAAVVFMITCLGLTYLSSGPSMKSVMENVSAEKPAGPALPEATPVQPATGTPSGGAVQGAPTESPTPQAPAASEAPKDAAQPSPAGSGSQAPAAKQ